MQLKRNGKQVDNDSLLFTQYKSSLPFIAQADANYKKQQEEYRKKLIEEINRRNAEGSYDV